MPFLPYHTKNQSHTIYIGKCAHSDMPGHVRYAVVSLRGSYTLQEASAFVIDMLDQGHLPLYEEYFMGYPIYVQSLSIYVKPPLSPKFAKICYYIDHYSVLDYISQYEWNVARHDIHQFVHPKENKTPKVFGDYLSDDEVDTSPLGDYETRRGARRPR